MKHKKILILLVAIAITWFGYVGYKYYVNHTVVRAISPYLPNAKVNIVRTEIRNITFTDETSQPEMDNLSNSEGSRTVFINNLKTGDRAKLYYFRVLNSYNYKGIDLSEKWCDGLLCFRFFMGYAYIDTTTGRLLRLDISKVSPLVIEL
ncbi:MULTISPECIES: hypothetical protein [unclassified Paenibacillus]|uniref:hypothetical protein n=1 Tax=unclassified Paenibacillus TaxID=185978 RepID=UPI00278A82D0|nr:MULTISPECIES: hypothetical protein [unclassified Paenibacillus]MDQ0899383.1 hypothetical protein [Paenibacillus sp. V4I7]MDQ0914560.1 hypothetical protein [Paenibacillus sp. V4I5]